MLNGKTEQSSFDSLSDIINDGDGQSEAKEKAQRLLRSMPESSRRQVNELLGNKEALKQLLDSPKAREIMQKLRKND